MNSEKLPGAIHRRCGNIKSFDGTEIYYEVRGEGTPTIWVYGIACLMNHWHHQTENFSRKNQVISFDLRGHNKSQIPKNLSLMTVESMAKDLLALMDHLEIKKAHLMGHSFGVPVLIYFSDLAPDRISSLTFINGFAKNPIQGMFGVDLVEKLFAVGKTAHKNVPGLWNFMWKKAVMNPMSFILTGGLGGFNLGRTEWKDIEIYAKAVSEMSLDMFIPLFEDMMKFDGQIQAERIKAPTLVIAGDRDFVTPISFQRALHESIAGSEYLEIKSGSHCTQLDFPDRVNRAIADLILRTEGKKPKESSV